jgi:transposase
VGDPRILGLSENAHGEYEAAVNQHYEKSVQYVGIDLHRRCSVVLRMDGEGEVVDCVRIDNSVPNLVAEVAKAGPGAEVAVEATYGWYWAVDALSQAGFVVTLAHPRGITSMQNRRAKTDRLDAKELADLLRIGRLASAWIAPPQVRELRELVRYRHKLVHMRAGVKASVHAVLGKCGVIPEIADVFGPVGVKMLDALVPEPYASRIASQRRILAALTAEITLLEVETATRLKDNREYRALPTPPPSDDIEAREIKQKPAKRVAAGLPALIGYVIVVKWKRRVPTAAT